MRRLWPAGVIVTAGLVVLLFPLGSFGRANADAHVWAGTWTTSYPDAPTSGTITFRFVSDAAGKQALADLIGLNAPSDRIRECSEPSDYYVGEFTRGTDSGTHAGCLFSSSNLRGHYRSASTAPRIGEFSISISASDQKSFSGSYTFPAGCIGPCTFNWSGTCSGGACAAAGDAPEVALTVKAGSSAPFASSARVGLGTTVLIRAVVSPRMPSAAHVIIRYRRKGGTRSLIRTCSGTPCTVERKSGEPATLVFDASVITGTPGQPDYVELASSRTVTVVWAEPQLAVTLAVKASARVPYDRLARVEVGTTVLLRATVAPDVPAGTRVTIRYRRAGNSSAYLIRTCTGTPCIVQRKSNRPAGEVYQASVIRGTKVLGQSPAVTVIWIDRRP